MRYICRELSAVSNVDNKFCKNAKRSFTYHCNKYTYHNHSHHKGKVEKHLKTILYKLRRINGLNLNRFNYFIASTATCKLEKNLTNLLMYKKLPDQAKIHLIFLPAHKQETTLAALESPHLKDLEM